MMRKNKIIYYVLLITTMLSYSTFILLVLMRIDTNPVIIAILSLMMLITPLIGLYYEKDAR